MIEICFSSFITYKIPALLLPCCCPSTLRANKRLKPKAEVEYNADAAPFGIQLAQNTRVTTESTKQVYLTCASCDICPANG